MKTTYNRSKIMKLANHYVKYEGYTRSQALTIAWGKARRSEFYWIVEKREVNTSIGFEINMLADSLINYYANNRYNGD